MGTAINLKHPVPDHAKIFGWAKSAAYDRRSTIYYNSQQWDWRQTEILCDVWKIQ